MKLLSVESPIQLCQELHAEQVQFLCSGGVICRDMKNSLANKQRLGKSSQLTYDLRPEKDGLLLDVLIGKATAS